MHMKFPIETQLLLAAKKTDSRHIETVADKLRIGLKRHKAADLSESNFNFDFRGGMFRMTTNWNLFYAVSRVSIALKETDDEIRVQATLHYTGASISHTFLTLGIIFANIMLLRQNGLATWPVNLVMICVAIIIPVANFSISTGRIKGFLKEILS